MQAPSLVLVMVCITIRQQSIRWQVDMVDPVIAADGSTYERTAIQQWLQQHNTSPVTGVALAHTRLVPNIVVRQAITYQQQQQWE